MDLTCTLLGISPGQYDSAHAFSLAAKAPNIALCVGKGNVHVGSTPTSTSSFNRPMQFIRVLYMYSVPSK